MLILTVIILIIIELFAWNRYRDVKSPAFLHGILWIIALINLQTMHGRVNLRSEVLAIFIIGEVVFQVGFMIGLHIKVKQRNYSVFANNSTMKWLIVVLVVLAIPVIYQYIGFIRSYGGSIYTAIRRAGVTLNLPSLFDYYRKITQFLFFCFVIVYWKEPKEKRRSLRGYVFALFIIAMLATISVPTRNSVLFFMLPLVMIWFCTHQTSNKRIAVILLFSSIAFVAIFYIISTGKYWYLYAAQGASRSEIIIQELQTYLSGGIAAFSETWKIHSFTRLGGNTFRFFVAIGDAIFGSRNAVPLVNEFTTIGSSITTNVYTFYDFYTRDFGIVYSILAQFLFAIIHGVSYNKMKKGNLMSIYLFGMLSYPLIMQFFQDQYISLLSTWIQILLVGFVVFGTRLFFRKEYTE